MSISTLILYGSCARQDNHPSSDVDLFGVGVGADYRMVVASKVNLAVYSKDVALRMSRAGDLFLLHIVREGRPIYDDDGFFRALASSFEFKISYAGEVEKAAELGWALLALTPSTKNWTLINRRIAWCVRTIVIAQAAEQRRAIFSARELTEFSGDSAVHMLIGNKESEKLGRTELEAFRQFLGRHSDASVAAVLPKDPPALLARFHSKGNVVGEKTVRALLGESVRASYT